jgi:hypothetical protein
LYLLHGLVKRSWELFAGADSTCSECYVRASPGEVERRLFTDAPAGAGDDDDFA